MTNGMILSRSGFSAILVCGIVSGALLSGVETALAADRMVLAENGTGTW